MGRGTIGRRARAGWLALAAAAGLLLAGTAEAHTGLRSSSPAAGDTVVAGVDTIRLTFTTRVDPRFTSLALARDGAPLPAAALERVPGEERVLVLVVPGGLAAGAYEATWRTAGADGHVVSGSFGFTVVPDPAAPPTPAAPPAAAPQPDAPPPSPAPVVEPIDPVSPLMVAVRWGGFVGLLGMIGAAAFSVGVLPRVRGAHPVVAGRAAVGVWALALAATALSVLTLLARLWLQSLSLNGPGAAMEGENLRALLGDTVWGRAWTLQLLATIGYVAALAGTRSPYLRQVAWPAAAVGAFLLAWVPALSGHAAAHEGARGLAIVTDFGHVLGAGVWLGTLAVLLAAGVPAALSTGEDGVPAVAALTGAFTPLALGGAALAAATGVGSALFHLASPADLVSTAYGRALLLKVGLVLVVALLGLVNWRRQLPRLGAGQGTEPLLRTARIEIAVGVLVVLVTAVLVALPPPTAG